MFTVKKVLRTLIFVCLVTLAGCETVNSGFGGVLNLDTDLTLTLEVASDINPDERGTPSPLYLRFYQLKDKKMFGRADFIQIYDQGDEVLGDDLVSLQKLKLVKPGESRKEKFVLEEDTRFIGLYAEFFEYKDASYKVIVPVTTDNVIRNTVTVKITQNKLKLLEK